jgi:hypothetical protein
MSGPNESMARNSTSYSFLLKKVITAETYLFQKVTTHSYSYQTNVTSYIPNYIPFLILFKTTKTCSPVRIINNNNNNNNKKFSQNLNLTVTT